MYTASNLIAALILTMCLVEAASPQVLMKEEAAGVATSESRLSALALQEALARALGEKPRAGDLSGAVPCL